MSRPTYMTIDLSALSHNLTRVHELAPGRSVIAMVKANAYGHGLERIASALHHADALGVASLEEGVKLREAGIQKPIVLMEGLFYPDELIEAAYHEFILVVHHLPHIEMLENTQTPYPFRIWLKINTGMNRLGFSPSDVITIYQRLMCMNSVQKPIGFMTHFAQADYLSSDVTQSQIALFEQMTSTLPGLKSLANSAAIIAWPNSLGDWVRPGLMLYGASPFANQTGLDHGLQPVMTLWSRLIAVSSVKKGSKVGYGGTWTATDDTVIGIVGVGYGDGYPQFAENGTPVLVNNQIGTLAGRVSMDMLAVDLGQQQNAKVGDPVVLWGKGLPVEVVAKHSKTSAYEILTRMTPRPKIEIKD
jgi:alanine racemase